MSRAEITRTSRRWLFAARGPSVGSFDVAADGRLLMTRRADLLPGDEARVVLIQNWLAAIKK